MRKDARRGPGDPTQAALPLGTVVPEGIICVWTPTRALWDVVRLVEPAWVNKRARNNRVRVVRDGTVTYEGNIASLKRFKDDVRSVRQGFECGIGVENFNDVKEGDQLEIYEITEVARTL